MIVQATNRRKRKWRFFFFFCSKHLFILWDNGSALLGQNSFVNRVWIGLEVQSFHGRLFCKCDRWCWSEEQKSEIVYLTCHAVLLPPSCWFQQALKFRHQKLKTSYMYLWKVMMLLINYEGQLIFFSYWNITFLQKKLNTFETSMKMASVLHGISLDWHSEKIMSSVNLFTINPHWESG